MSPLWMIPIQLVIIAASIIAVLIVGPEQHEGRHRLNRRLHDEELAEIEIWLSAIRASGKTSGHRSTLQIYDD